MKDRKYGAICHAGGRNLEIVSAHQQWLDWALTSLYHAAEPAVDVERITSAARAVLNEIDFAHLDRLHPISVMAQELRAALGQGDGR